MDEVAIRVNKVSKNFALPHEKARSIKEVFVSPFRTAMHKNVTTQHALKNISFEVKKGEFFGIVGRNGSGKSTLLKMLAGIYQPTKGTVNVRGKLVPFIELGVGFNPELTGRENVYLNGALLGFSEKEIDAMYDEIVAFAELSKFMDQKLKNYSSGMQVRLAFSMAVRAKADILLIDEVLAVGDANFQRKCFEYFKQLKKDKVTVVFVSHDMGAVQEYCDRVVLIDKNELQSMGAANVIAEQYSKLFNTSKVPRQSLASSKAERWGDNKASVVSVKTLVKKDSIGVSYTVRANDDVENIIAGFRIRSTDGKDVVGTNTKKEKVEPITLSKGQEVTISWSMPNILSDGDYFIDPSLVYWDEISVLDWWNEADVFSIRKNRKLPYVLDPGFEVTISE